MCTKLTCVADECRSVTKRAYSWSVLDLGFDQGGGIPHQAEKGGGIWQLGGGVF